MSSAAAIPYGETPTYATFEDVEDAAYAQCCENHDSVQKMLRRAYAFRDSYISYSASFQQLDDNTKQDMMSDIVYASLVAVRQVWTKYCYCPSDAPKCATCMPCITLLDIFNSSEHEERVVQLKNEILEVTYAGTHDLHVIQHIRAHIKQYMLQAM